MDGTHISPVTHCQKHLMFVGLVSICVEPVDATQAATVHIRTWKKENNKGKTPINLLCGNSKMEILYHGIL